jgi:hypothetical protein
MCPRVSKYYKRAEQFRPSRGTDGVPHRHQHGGCSSSKVIIFMAEGVNVAARLEALAQPGGVCLSKNVLEIVNKKTDFQFHDLGEQTVKNTVLHAVDVTLNGNLKENFQNPKLEECISDMSLEQVIPYLRAGDLVWTDIDDQSHFDRALNKIYPSIKQQQNLKQVAK